MIATVVLGEQKYVNTEAPKAIADLNLVAIQKSKISEVSNVIIGHMQ